VSNEKKIQRLSFSSDEQCDERTKKLRAMGLGHMVAVRAVVADDDGNIVGEFDAEIDPAHWVGFTAKVTL